MKEARCLLVQGALDTAHLRTMQFESREHLVVPVIALVEGVVHAVNSDQPEYVPGTELARAPLGWNGRPVVGDHPSDGT
ncbi:MAG TPA: hypothetical protein VK509_01865, partial [Polyangiales bacterium]|nr:hypothetical protein [Polyangiales bacterium]